MKFSNFTGAPLISSLLSLFHLNICCSLAQNTNTLSAIATARAAVA